MSEHERIRSGIPPLDRQIGGLVPGRPYVISGNPGTGKSVSCLEFLDVAIQHNEPAALLTHDDPRDVLTTAEFLGMDLDPALADGRLTILRFHLDFARRFGRASGPDEVFTELRRQLHTPAPRRLAIDSVVPFLEGGGSSSAAMFALTRHLEEMGVTALLTYPGDLGGLYDRRLEPLMQRAGGLFHLAAVPGGRRRGTLEIRKLRFEAPSVAPIQFRIEPGAGFVQDGEPNAPEDPLRAERQNHLLLVNLDTPFPDEMLQGLERGFRVTVRGGVTAAFSDLVRSGVGGVLLNVRRDVINDALQLVRELRNADVRVPIMLVSPYVLRSSDRTRALRAGADEFVSLTVPPDELVERVASMTRRGRSPNTVPARSDRPMVLQPTSAGGGYVPMDRQAFATAVRSHIGMARAPYFTLVVLRPENGDSALAAELVLRTARMDSGDLVGVDNGQVMVLADGARPKDLESLFARLTTQWAGNGKMGALQYEAIAYPTEDDRVHEMLGVTVG
jgi:circadian clock protein KaiC